MLNELAWWCAAHNPAIEKALQPSTDGRAHAAPTLFTLSGEAFWLPTLGNETADLLHDSARIDAVVDTDGGTPVACCCRLRQFRCRWCW